MALRFDVLATDYDGTLARQGKVDQTTISALEIVRSTGRHLVMVTGREMNDLESVFPKLDLFDLVVAENGAVLYYPFSRASYALHDPPPARFVAELRAKGVSPLSVGEVIVATREPYEKVVLQTIKQFGLELEIIFNKGAVMVLPSGINKGTGLAAALHKLGLAAERTVGVGDAENDHAFLRLCGCGVAVSNALPALKETADWVTEASHGAGVAELADLLVRTDLEVVAPHADQTAHSNEHPGVLSGFGTQPG